MLTRKVTPVTYEVNMQDKRKKRRIFHVNRLKEWNMSVDGESEQGKQRDSIVGEEKENEMKVGNIVGAEQLKQVHSLQRVC